MFDSQINLGKSGTFNSSSLIGTPYHLTWEIEVVDKQEQHVDPKLRLVPAAELSAEILGTDVNAQDDDEPAENVKDENGDVVMRNNRMTVDDTSRQILSMEDIEEMKKIENPKEIIAKIMAAHTGLDEKTAFSLAKYTLRKRAKYLRRFTVLPLDVEMLVEVWQAKEAGKIMDLRVETLSLLTNWANVHHAGTDRKDEPQPEIGGGRWLVVDDTNGLVLAAVADKMGILYPSVREETEEAGKPESTIKIESTVQPETDIKTEGDSKEENAHGQQNGNEEKPQDQPKNSSLPHLKDLHQTATTNTITLIHPNIQPSISMLKYFGYQSEEPATDHPLYSNLLTITWLQLIDPKSDGTYSEQPEDMTEEELAKMKSNRRGAYHRKRRRWQRVKRVVDVTRAGGFDGLVVASHMEPAGVLKHLVPLVKGGGQVAVYSPTVEPLTELQDLYSRDRRSAYLGLVHDRMERDEDIDFEHEDFPVNPTLLLHSSILTARAIDWQVLPERTHPLMTMKGGSEGYVFTATRVLPAQTQVSARGRYSKKRKVEDSAVEGASKRAKSIESDDGEVYTPV